MERLVESNITMSNHILQTNNVLVQALAQANKDLKEANKDLKEAMMEANKNLKDANDKLYNLAMSCKQGQNRPQPANFDFGNQANEQQFADNLFGNLQQPNRDGVQQVFVEQQQNPVAGQQVGQQQQNLHGFGQPRY
uniref:Uncharacterized protein n=1 Tax=Meloidogyne hapla TaxID=6305 RepID=A0A1I8AZI1_MELHA